ncbi:MAG: hypothetical protein VX000_10190, partial [Myxococcota bacterium]|nr:hypothetical protein [Myxococcota bacterium]
MALGFESVVDGSPERRPVVSRVHGTVGIVPLREDHDAVLQIGDQPAAAVAHEQEPEMVGVADGAVLPGV